MIVKVVLEMNCESVNEFEENLGANDGQFALKDSIMWQLRFGSKKDMVGYHNNIKMTLNEEAYDLTSDNRIIRA